MSDKPDKNKWQTPRWLTDGIDERHDGGINTDPCAPVETPLPPIGNRLNLTKEDDGLTSDWVGTAFVNPPFDNKIDWFGKAFEECYYGDVDAVYFVSQDNTDTKKWWHNTFSPNCNSIWLSEGRVKYLNLDGEDMGSPPFGTAIGMFGDVSESALRWLNNHGVVMTKW